MSRFSTATTSASTNEHSDPDGLAQVNQQDVSRLQQDTPQIYTTVKNLIAYLVGKGLNSTKHDEVRLNSTNAMLCAKVLLQTIQAYELPNVEAYAATHPQLKEQTGMERLDQIIRYKTVLQLRSVALQHGGKVSRLFGRLYFVWTQCWEPIMQLTKTKLLDSHNVPSEEVDVFLDTYGATLLSSEREQPQPQYHQQQLIHSDSGTTSDYYDHDDITGLIWAQDFSSTLQERQKRRVSAVQDRLDLLALEKKNQDIVDDMDGGDGDELGGAVPKKDITSNTGVVDKDTTTAMT